MKTKRSQEAYVLIDHRNSPGVSPEFIRAHNLDAPAVGAGTVFESAMAMCHGCGTQVILNPDRSRVREWCSKHDAYLCDACGAARKAGAACVPLAKIFDDAYEKIVRNS